MRRIRNWPTLAIVILTLCLSLSTRAADDETASDSAVVVVSAAVADDSAEESSADDFDDDFDDWEVEFDDDEDMLEEDSQAIADPLNWWNKMWFHMNDKLHFWVLKPASKGFGSIFGRPLRVGIQNFFENIEMPRRAMNCLFQGRFRAAGSELWRFSINITVGVLGFWDPAGDRFEIPIHDRDFDQTLAKAHAGKGVYLTWPFFGPSTVRGTFGLIMDLVLDPATYLPGSGVVERMNNLSLDPDADVYESLVKAALDPYVAVRNAYVQYRDKKGEE